MKLTDGTTLKSHLEIEQSEAIDPAIFLNFVGNLEDLIVNLDPSNPTMQINDYRFRDTVLKIIEDTASKENEEEPSLEDKKPKTSEATK